MKAKLPDASPSKGAKSFQKISSTSGLGIEGLPQVASFCEHQKVLVAFLKSHIPGLTRASVSHEAQTSAMVVGEY